jgi:tape measure domain-containing protein
MTQVSSYFATMGIEIDKRSFAEVDKYFERLEQKLQRLGKSTNAFAINLKFNVDTSRARLTIQRDLNAISRGLSLRLNTFSINNHALRNLLNQSMSNRAGNARIKLNVALSSSSLSNMRAQVLGALNNLVITPQINPRMGRGGGNGMNVAGGGAAQGGRGGSSGFNPLGMLSRGFLPLAGLYGAQRAFMSFSDATQLQATRDVAARGLFQNATMPDGSTRDVYQQSDSWFRNYTNKAGLNRNELTPAFQGFMASSMPTLGYEKSRDIFQAFSSFGTVRGATADSMKRGLVAVQQMASKGKVSAEELRQQLGDAQGFGEAQMLFAQAWQMLSNKTNNPMDPRLLKGSAASSALGDAMKKGNVISQDILPIVAQLMQAKAAPALEAASQTGTANQNRLANARTDFFANFAKGGGDAGLSNIWKTLAELTESAANNSEMLGANFRIATAYASIFVATLQDFGDFMSGNAARGNIFADMVDPEFMASLNETNKTVNEMIAAWKSLDLSEITNVMTTFMNSSLSALKAVIEFISQLKSLVTLDFQGFQKSNDSMYADILGIFSTDAKNKFLGENQALMNGPPVPPNTPQAATGPLANYGGGGTKNTTQSVVINNQVTVSDKANIGTTIDQLNQSSMAANLQPFLTTMDKAAFPNSGQ